MQAPLPTPLPARSTELRFHVVHIWWFVKGSSERLVRILQCRARSPTMQPEHYHAQNVQKVSKTVLIAPPKGPNIRRGGCAYDPRARRGTEWGFHALVASTLKWSGEFTNCTTRPDIIRLLQSAQHRSKTSRAFRHTSAHFALTLPHLVGDISTV